VGRREKVEKTVDYICRQLDQLSVLESLPDGHVQPEQLMNRATDILSAVLTYLAVHIRHEPGRFGVVGIQAFLFRIINFPR
jgi:hypothetical protein